MRPASTENGWRQPPGPPRGLANARSAPSAAPLDPSEQVGYALARHPRLGADLPQRRTLGSAGHHEQVPFSPEPLQLGGDRFEPTGLTRASAKRIHNDPRQCIPIHSSCERLHKPPQTVAEPTA